MDDLISRAAAIEALDSINCCGYVEEPWDIVRGIIERVPAAVPDKRTEERTETHACNSISRQAAIDALNEQIWQCDKALSSFDISMKDEYAVKVERASLVAYKEQLEALPSAQPERKTGRWTKAYDGNDDHVKCTGCFKTYDWISQAQYYNYCPNCGAYMRGDTE